MLENWGAVLDPHAVEVVPDALNFLPKRTAQWFVRVTEDGENVVHVDGFYNMGKRSFPCCRNRRLRPVSFVRGGGREKRNCAARLTASTCLGKRSFPLLSSTAGESKLPNAAEAVPQLPRQIVDELRLLLVGVLVSTTQNRSLHRSGREKN